MSMELILNLKICVLDLKKVSPKNLDRTVNMTYRLTEGLTVFQWKR
jgi:hypothetical protein